MSRLLRGDAFDVRDMQDIPDIWYDADFLPAFSLQAILHAFAKLLSPPWQRQITNTVHRLLDLYEHKRTVSDDSADSRAYECVSNHV